MADAERQERPFKAVRRDHLSDRNDGESRSRAEAGGGRARRQSAPVGKPLQRIADAGSVNRTGADARDYRAGVEKRDGIGDRIQHPCERDHAGAEENDDARSISIDEPGFDRNEPGSVMTKIVKANWMAGRPQ